MIKRYLRVAFTLPIVIAVYAVVILVLWPSIAVLCIGEWLEADEIITILGAIMALMAYLLVFCIVS